LAPGEWSNNNGASCGDSLFCNGVEVCSSGTCVSPGSPCPGPDGDANCSESCDETADSCLSKDPYGSACNDGNPLTEIDFCDGSGLCVDQVQVEADCKECHNGNPAYPLAPNIVQGTPGVDSVWDGSWWDSTQGGDDATQQGGHGDPDGKAAVKCTDCHDVSLPPGYHLNGVLESTGPSTVGGEKLPQNVNENTAHLRAEFIAAEGGPSYSVQVQFDNTCAASQLPTQTGSCHSTNSAKAPSE
jgi:hypothetical protein